MYQIEVPLQEAASAAKITPVEVSCTVASG